MLSAFKIAYDWSPIYRIDSINQDNKLLLSCLGVCIGRLYSGGIRTTWAVVPFSKFRVPFIPGKEPDDAIRENSPPPIFIKWKKVLAALRFNFNFTYGPNFETGSMFRQKSKQNLASTFAFLKKPNKTPTLQQQIQQQFDNF